MLGRVWFGGIGDEWGGWVGGCPGGHNTPLPLRWWVVQGGRRRRCRIKSTLALSGEGVGREKRNDGHDELE